jgi:hypothetical protein
MELEIPQTSKYLGISVFWDPFVTAFGALSTFELVLVVEHDFQLPFT